MPVDNLQQNLETEMPNGVEPASAPPYHCPEWIQSASCAAQTGPRASNTRRAKNKKNTIVIWAGGVLNPYTQASPYSSRCASESGSNREDQPPSPCSHTLSIILCSSPSLDEDLSAGYSLRRKGSTCARKTQCTPAGKHHQAGVPKQSLRSIDLPV